MSTLEEPVSGAVQTTVGGLTVDEVAAGIGRVKRVVYPPGWDWRREMQAVTNTEWCEHAHVGFIAQGEMAVEFKDGCSTTYRAPCFVITEPGHAGHVVSDEAVVLVQVDCGKETEDVFGLGNHTHDHT